jgi:CBP4
VWQYHTFFLFSYASANSSFNKPNSNHNYSGATLCIGGPALVYYVTPTEEELFKRYNPDLQRRSLENRLSKQQDFDKFVTNLKEYSKSDKPSMPLIPTSLIHFPLFSIFLLVNQL